MPIWNTRSNEEAWKLYIADFNISDSRFKYASPSVEKIFSNLPPTLTYIGTEDPFYAETVELIANLKSAGVQVDFKIFEGCYHAFDVVCPLAAKSKEARKFLLDGFARAYQNYIKKETNDD
jgi:acetyl esterase/lipase